VHSGSSYASQSELTLTFGLGEDTGVSRIDVEWPSGRTQTFQDLAPNQAISVDETHGLRLSGGSTRPRKGGGAPPR
jgi:enediyne biosynthesis protein E4